MAGPIEDGFSSFRRFTPPEHIFARGAFLGGEVCGFNQKSKSENSGNTVFVLANIIISHQPLLEDLSNRITPSSMLEKGSTKARFPRFVVVEGVFHFLLKAYDVSLAQMR